MVQHVQQVVEMQGGRQGRMEPGDRHEGEEKEDRKDEFESNTI